MSVSLYSRFTSGMVMSRRIACQKQGCSPATELKGDLARPGPGGRARPLQGRLTVGGCATAVCPRTHPRIEDGACPAGGGIEREDGARGARIGGSRRRCGGSGWPAVSGCVTAVRPRTHPRIEDGACPAGDGEILVIRLKFLGMAILHFVKRGHAHARQGRSPAVAVKGNPAKPGSGRSAARRGQAKGFRRETRRFGFV